MDNILYNSYKLDSLAMARQMLNWHDELKLAGWDFEYPHPETRLGAVAGIARLFDMPCLGDRLKRMLQAVETSADGRFADMDVHLPYTCAWLSPLLRRLVDGVVARGARVHTIATPATDTTLARLGAMLQPGAEGGKVKLGNDGSLRILKFDTRIHQDEYLANHPELKAQLWIAADTRALDSRLSAIGRPTMGSKVQTRSRIVSLMPLLLSLFNSPLNIYNLVEWLSSPQHPLPGRLRYRLASAIAENGGYKHGRCDEIIEAYLNGDYEYLTPEQAEMAPDELAQVKEQGRPGREDTLRSFLPYLYPEGSITDSLDALRAWARKRLFALTDGDDQDILAAQYSSLIDGVDNLLLIADDSQQLTAAELLRWSRQLLSDLPVEHHPAQIGAVYHVSSPGDIIHTAENTLWTSVEGMEAEAAECSFLHPRERAAIAGNASFIDPNIEANVRQHAMAWPFVMTAGCLTLTYAMQHSGEAVLRHPLLLRLESQIENFNDFVAEPDCTKLQTAQYQRFSNTSHKAEFEVRNSHKIQWPAMMSATALETLTAHPFDYFFDKVLGLRAAGMATLPQFATTKGNVAHAVIEKYFTKHPTVGSDVEALNKLDFEQMLAEATAECGAVFDLPEHVLDTQFFRNDLYRCIENLMIIIRDNRLSVVACEESRRGCMGFTDDERDDLIGFIDMVLEDANGQKFIFDFKWTGSRTYHRELLKQNRSIQLAIYQALVDKSNAAAIPTGYYLMPEGRLVTASALLSGDNIEQITADDSTPLMPRAMNSYRYRRSQIVNSGRLEAYDLGQLDQLSYHLDTEVNNLLPLPHEYNQPEIKAANKYSSYQLFKGL